MNRLEKISQSQLRCLLTLFAAYAQHSLDLNCGGRDQRLAWASKVVGRPLSSFLDLGRAEAGALIDDLKRSLGQEVRPAWRRPRDRQAALAAGTHGRRGDDRSVQVMAGPEELQELDQLRERLGWTREAFEKWLVSPTSPVGGRTQLRTLADCNRVRWALKAMVRRRRQIAC